MKSICLISEEFPPDTNLGGISTYNKNLAELLVKNGYRVTVITRSLGKSYYLKDGDINIYRLKPINFFNLLFLNKLLGFRITAFIKLLILTRKQKIDIIESPEWKAETFFILLFKNLIPGLPKIIIRLHGCRAIIREYDGTKINIADKIVIYMERYVLKKCSYISSISNSCLVKTESLLNISLKNKTRVIFNSIKHENDEAHYSMNQQTKSILFVGRIEELKGILILAKAMSFVFEKFENTNLLLVGRDIENTKTGEYYSQIIKNIIGKKNENKVIYMGQRNSNELDEIYKNSYITVLPSRFESFGLCCIESMKNGTPVIGSRSGGMSEIITEGQDGFLIDPTNVDELIAHIEILLNNENLRNEFSEKSKLKIQSTFSNNIIFNQIDNYYNHVIKDI